jgi:hypothetical protein
MKRVMNPLVVRCRRIGYARQSTSGLFFLKSRINVLTIGGGGGGAGGFVLMDVESFGLQLFSHVGYIRRRVKINSFFFLFQWGGGLPMEDKRQRPKKSQWRDI